MPKGKNIILVLPLVLFMCCVFRPLNSVSNSNGAEAAELIAAWSRSIWNANVLLRADHHR